MRMGRFILFLWLLLIANGVIGLEIQKRTMYITFMSEFNENIQIKINNKLIKEKYQKTNPSTGACNGSISVQIGINDTIVIKSKKKKKELKIIITEFNKTLLIFYNENDNEWNYDFINKPLKLK